jgi:hypothetical protein
MRWVRHFRQLRKKKNAYKRRRNHLGDLDVDGRIILTQILQKYSVKMWTGFIWLSIRSSNGLV